MNMMITEEFKEELFALYTAYDSVYGPYTRKDGRKHVVMYKKFSLPKSKGRTKTISWPKALLEVKYKRLLSDDETVDHIDEDFTNDDLGNLQILTREENIKKSLLMRDIYHKNIEIRCDLCGTPFSRRESKVHLARKYNLSGMFCSRICAGKNNQQIQQNARVSQRQRKGS